MRRFHDLPRSFMMCTLDHGLSVYKSILLHGRPSTPVRDKGRVAFSRIVLMYIPYEGQGEKFKCLPASNMIYSCCFTGAEEKTTLRSAIERLAGLCYDVAKPKKECLCRFSGLCKLTNWYKDWGQTTTNHLTGHTCTLPIRANNPPSAENDRSISWACRYCWQNCSRRLHLSI